MSPAHQCQTQTTTAEATPVTRVISPLAMKSMETESGGPVIPRSNSRATVRSDASDASSRCPIPCGRTHASVSRS